MLRLEDLEIGKEIEVANGIDFLGDVSFLKYGGLFCKQLGGEIVTILVESNDEHFKVYYGVVDLLDINPEESIYDLEKVADYMDIDIDNDANIHIINGLISYYGVENFLDEEYSINGHVDAMNLLLEEGFISVNKSIQFFDVRFEDSIDISNDISLQESLRKKHEDLLYYNEDVTHETINNDNKKIYQVSKVFEGIVAKSPEEAKKLISEEELTDKKYLKITNKKSINPELSIQGIKYLNEYNNYEFGSDFDYKGENEIGLAYTEIEDDFGNEYEVQASIHIGREINLITTRDNQIVELIKYKSIKDLEDTLLSSMDFDELIYPGYNLEENCFDVIE